jgi:hypothetical protein
MQSLTKTAAWTVFAVAFAGIATQTSYVSPSSAAAPVVKASAAMTTTAAAAVQALKPAAPPVIALAPAADAPAVEFGSEKHLRARMKYETVRWGGKPVQTLDEESRVLLAQAAARKARLEDVGLSFHDVYGVIEAETSWIPRDGASKDGTANLGLAQFEPRTARGLGVTDPSDPVQAVFGAAMYMKEGAAWASRKLAGLKLSPEQHALKVREGVSIYYNLSIKGRNKWDGMNAAELPIETQRHIHNARMGAAEAAELARLIRT